MFGSKCYNFLRKYWPLPHETVLRHWYSPEVKKYINNLMDLENTQKIIEEFVTTGMTFNATLSVDAAKFKEVKGDVVLNQFPELSSIKTHETYNNIFVFYIQPINVDLKPFPIHIALAQHGTATDHILNCIDRLAKILDDNGITTDFVATDGDHKYDKLHDEFFEIILNLHQGGYSFDQITEKIANTKVIKIPISDFLHSLKIFRSNLVKYGICIENANGLTVLPESLEIYNLGKTITDLSQQGKMKDAYPLDLFSSDHIKKAIEIGDWPFVFYSLPFNLLINAIRNPEISFDMRKFNLETSFYFMLHYFYQMLKSVSPPHSRIGIVRMINTIVGIAVAIMRYDFVQTGHIGTHPLENYFGFLRVACNNDHSYCSIFRAIGKAIYVRGLLDELGEEAPARSRLGYGGVKANVESIDGVIPDFTPFQLFKLVWSKAKFLATDSTLFESWFPVYKPIDWSERIAMTSSLSGANIVSRYYNQPRKTEAQSKEIVEMKRRKQVRYDRVRNLHTMNAISSDELASLVVDEPFMFFTTYNTPVNVHLVEQFIDDDDPHDFARYQEQQRYEGLKSLRNWMKKHSYSYT